MRHVVALSLSAALAACGPRSSPAPSAERTTHTAEHASSASTLEPASTAAPTSAHGAGASHDDAPTWQQGAAALAQARARREPLLVYVSSAWCPPCRALEANVLSTPAFARAARGLTLVKLSGDAEGTQALVDELGARTYPTLLVLAGDGEELFRSHQAVSLAELRPVLLAAGARERGLRAARARLEAGAQTELDCRLFAALDWGAPSLGDGAVATLERALERCTDVAARARLAGARLGLAALARTRGGTGGGPGGANGGAKGDANGDANDAERAVRAKAPALLDAMLASDEASYAARTWLSSYARPVCEWLTPREGPERDALRERWLGAVRSVRARADAPLDVWLSSHQAELDLYRCAHREGPLPEPLRRTLVEAATRAADEAKTPAQRNATLGTAAYFLREAGERARARALLEGALAASDDPTHHLVTLSEWAHADGDRAGALALARRAADEARGRPSRLQWMVHELGLLAREPSPRAAFFERADATYDVLFAASDAFVGRNLVRARELAKLMAAASSDPRARALVQKHAPRCATLPEASRAACVEHFAAR